MGLFDGVKKAAREKEAKIQAAFEDGMGHFCGRYGSSSYDRASEAMETFSYCIEKFDGLHKSGKDEAKGYFMASKKWLSTDALSSPDADAFLQNEYDKCEHYKWRFSLTMIMRPELQKRGMIKKDDLGRWIKNW